MDRPPGRLKDKSREHRGRGVSDGILDRGFWLYEAYSDRPWLLALEAIDRRGDKIPLLTLLRLDAELTPKARHYLADLLERYNLRRRRGGQQTPAYDLSAKEQLLWLAVYVQSRSRVSDAVEKAAKEFGLSVEKVANAYNGRRGSTRRIKKRASRPSP